MASARARKSPRGRAFVSETCGSPGAITRARVSDARARVSNARARVSSARARAESRISSDSPGSGTRARVSYARSRVSFRDSSECIARARVVSSGRAFPSVTSSSSFSAQRLPPKCFPFLKVMALTFLT